MVDRSASQSGGTDGLQVVEVTVDRGYHPALIRAQAELPLRLIFRRIDPSECAERVVFSAPRLERHLALGSTTIVDLPAQPAGEVRFTCGMGRYVGRIRLREPAPSLPARIGQRLGQIEAPLGVALVLWIGTLPLIAIIAVVALDASVAIGAATAALIAWVVGCLAAYRRTARTHVDSAALERSNGWRLRWP